ncbi:MAG: nucleotide pyrophosphohydrolase [Opitutae bacterium]|nr:nucleotide pyrophosphohydrolase [Opitutae bacterium]
MDITELTQRAQEIRARFTAQEISQTGRAWTRAEIAQGLVCDLGDLTKLVMAKEGRRTVQGDVDARLAHELSDCLWSVLVLADLYQIDLERAFLRTMDELESQLTPPASS